ncbi:L-histidine N(alpha)-methyltransferase [Formosa sediminum]|uniref:L-histidine N(Alpha)-methyltransferase n=1 Tax=Formosa sediminum TaxID=2594004 RepID=A0A516GSN6_9FLAO|nr:L-histidine N(alpha)-methyltransferase [Formosa sediminum]QDO94537.1 L-histidine N(alpha)-methyltransferase [Formosa sediminum]
MIELVKQSKSQKVNTAETLYNVFSEEVNSGLERNPKCLPSKYFYDQKGDALFVKIMNLPEYYLTRSELEIFQHKTNQLINALELHPERYFELVELGAGDGLKTKELLKVLEHQNYKFDYLPIDISSNALNLLEDNLKQELPKVSVKTKQGDYFKVLDALKESKHPKIILFLGSNIGNMSDSAATKFMTKLSANLNPEDKLLLGVDLIKSKSVVLPAYNDSQGVTAAFNLNLLARINAELGADFNLNQFKHKPEYDENEGIAKSFIESCVNQIVTIKALGKSFKFLKGEKIHTEISRKYNDTLITEIIANANFSLDTKILDSKAYFADYILTRNA